MVCLSCLLVVVMTYVCLPGFGSVCWDNAICNDLSNQVKIRDCIRLCMSVIQTEFPQLSALALNVNDDNELLLSILLATLVSENKISESELRAHSDERRSYSMEHFRWGKPSGRKRRPVKVFASSLEGGGSSEGSFPPQARRQLSSNEDEAKEELIGGNQNQGSPTARVGSKSQLSMQERKDGTYRMSHFRWGSPPASKRNGFMKQRAKKSQGQLAKLFRNIIVKDVQRIMG
ncbi:pro-opiomelanocortin-like isoform X1 [Sebastes umbrosus]|uniref:pro-opiomelanocortin-like isoform X1 n=1 Tax=Sebastes umbrosus TaxID=72105 RepID=UPI0018A11FD0|nr:pro-opiomelanocortin-like isoform X1 [Sebastes umbrosus]XP_037607249.1 pro-opiomelanocortin-like isoform X1 [Sebastes umbrosus]